MTELCELGYKYGTDKAGYYTHFYHTLFEHMRNDIKSLLEIGIGTVPAMKHVSSYKPGASLRMWEEYFPNALILGIDIEPSVMFKEGRIRTALIDQSKESELLTLNAKFDIIIDDGSHNKDHQVLSFSTLFDKVNKGGFYIIEDVNETDYVSSMIKFDHDIVKIRSGMKQGSCIVIKKF